MFLGIEIGGTKLQLGVGPDDGRLRGLWRGTVDATAGAAGIRAQIVAAIPELLAKSGVERGELRGVGVGFGGPVDDATRAVIRSHHIAGWDGFPLADWVADLVGLPAALGNDADVGGLAEALHGAGKGLSPIFYITVGTGIGGGLIIDGEIYRGVGRGAAEIGHIQVPDWRRHVGVWDSLEEIASGRAIGDYFRRPTELQQAGAFPDSPLFRLDPPQVSAREVGRLAAAGDELAAYNLDLVWSSLAFAIAQVAALLCPRRVIIGGGVSLLGPTLFEPLRRSVAEMTFAPFAGLTDIVPAALGEEVVVHGAIALARKKLT